ncbi:MAG: PQQ-binding-like beta-propeller repeat protein [Phycisphaerae bacterium]|nr:PQQ-binding-like beta-propeller repeat protein [Phycisphaerae bacterium]
MNRIIRQLTPIVIIAAAPFASASDWLQLAGGAQHRGHGTAAPGEMSATIWIANQDSTSASLVFEGPSSPVVFDGRVYANARVYSGSNHVANRIVAIDAATGAILFETPIMRVSQNSWSSPAVDSQHRRILIGSGNRVYAIDADSGHIDWETPLLRNIVNASVVVTDDAGIGRAFITDFDGAGTDGSLYCINTDAFDGIANPYLPGEIVWREPIGGTSGNSPAYLDGVVYVSSVTDPASPGFPGIGHLYAFNAGAADGQRLVWSVGVSEGFFGGVTVANGFVYAASYNSFGGANNSTLVKVRAADGVIQWTTACERSDSIPIVDGDRIYLSAGIPGFGSTPKVQAFVDHGTSASKVWDTYADTNGSLVVGGWTHQPILADGILYCGRIPSGNVFFGAYTEMFMLNVGVSPNDASFVIDHRAGFGSSPAISDGRLYSIGPDGLHAIAMLGDVCGGADNPVYAADGTVDGADIQCFVELLLSVDPSSARIAIADFDGDGTLTASDAALFADFLIGQ